MLSKMGHKATIEITIETSPRVRRSLTDTNKTRWLVMYAAYLFSEIHIPTSCTIEQALHKKDVEHFAVSMTQGRDLDMPRILGNSFPTS